MVTQALNSAISGLRVAQQQLNVISNNVANATNEGYTRKILPQSSRVLTGEGQSIGVQADLVIRQVDLNLARDLWTQISSVSALDVKSAYINRVITFHGPPDSELSIAAALSDLKDNIAGLADNPNDSFIQRTVLEQAERVAEKFNDFSELIINSRNDAQDEANTTLVRVNDLLQQIADINTQIVRIQSSNKSTADMEDLRDNLVKELANDIELTFFQRGDGVLVVQSSNGTLLADTSAVELYFDPTNIGATSFYPDSVAGIFAGGDPAENLTAVDLTQTDLGGKLGGLLELRDEILPRYQAQLDELAHQVARRFDAQGLRLFTDNASDLPTDAAPDLGTTPNTPVDYVGFAGLIQVNEEILANSSLLQTGTYVSDISVPSGSSEVLTRVLEYTFGDVEFQRAVGTTDITIASSGSADLQEHLGIYSTNQIVLGPDLTQYSEIDSGGAVTTDLVTALSDFLLAYPADDEFRIQLYDRSDAAVATTVDIDLSDLGADALYAIGAADPSGTLNDGTIDNALDQLVAYINTTIITEEGATNIPTDLQARASINSAGQFVFNSRGNVEFVTSGFANSMNDTGFQAIFGTTGQTFEAEDPYFDVKVGSADPVRITLAAGEDENDLLAKLEKLSVNDAGVPGLLVDDTAFAAGTLTLRPGIDDTNLNGPLFGGALKLVAGQGIADGTGVATSGDNIIEALFGSSAPIEDVVYQSETSQTLGVGSGTFVNFRSNNLGPGADINTGIASSASLIDFAQKMVTLQSQDLNFNDTLKSDEEALRDILSTRLLNESAVNIDEELSQLILVQTAYAAAARTVTAVDELFEELLNAVRR